MVGGLGWVLGSCTPSSHRTYHETEHARIGVVSQSYPLHPPPPHDQCSRAKIANAAPYGGRGQSRRYPLAFCHRNTCPGREMHAPFPPTCQHWANGILILWILHVCRILVITDNNNNNNNRERARKLIYLLFCDFTSSKEQGRFGELGSLPYGFLRSAPAKEAVQHKLGSHGLEVEGTGPGKMHL